ncbi:MAG: hypothetical protein GXP63_02670 [DPANN group archaeon]|nr:hypothetical protein [DPANN group archaeon]
MNVIIIAAIALLVLVVLSVIFLGRIGSFSEQTADCQNKGGQCLDACDSTYSIQYDAWSCPADSNQVCCVKA